MGLTLEQLVEAKTKEQLRSELLLALQGVGYVRKVGGGEGWLTLTGVAEDELDVSIKITTDGGLGTAEFQYSVDAGDTYNAVDILVPSGGQYVLPDSGVTLVFENGPGEADVSFLVGDFFSFLLSVPTLPTSSWHAGSTPLTIVETDAQANEDMALTIQSIAKSGFLTEAEDHWLDLVLEDVYDLERSAGQVAQHTVRLTDAGSGGPYSIAAGQLVVSGASGLRFSNIASGTLLQGSTLDLTFQAEQRGTAYNLGLGGISRLLTALPGVTVANIDVGSGSSITQQGVNRETDAAAQARAMLRWGERGDGAVEDAYALWATTASADVTRVLVKADPDVPGGVLLLLAGPAGTVDAGAISDVEDYIEPRVPFGSVLTVESAVATDVPITATVYVRAGYGSSALADMLTNLTALFQGGTNTTGELLPGIEISDGTVKVFRAELIEQMQIAAGVRNVDLATLVPAGDTTLADERVATLDTAPVLTIVEV